MMNHRLKFSLFKNERGGAILQIMAVFLILGIITYSLLLMIRKSEQSGLYVLNRNNALNLSTIVSDNLNDTYFVKQAALTIEQAYP